MATPEIELVSEPTIDRAAINRANSEHSTGPRTPKAKSASASTPPGTGMYSSEVVLPTEDRAAYDRLGEYLAATWNPVNEEAHRLVQLLRDTNGVSTASPHLSAICFLSPRRTLRRHGLRLQPGHPRVPGASRRLPNQRAHLDQFSKHETRLRRLYDQPVSS